MPLRRAFLHNPFHVGKEAHIEHAIGFIQYEILDAIQLTRALLQMIKQPTGRRHHDIHARPESFRLPSVPDAAKYHRHANIRKARQIAKGRLDLGCKFASWLENQGTRHICPMLKAR